MGKTYGEWLVRWKIPVLVATLLLVAWAGSGVRFLTFKTDYRVFFSEDNPQMQAFEQLQNTYTKTDNVLFVLAPKDGRVFTPETLASVAWLTDASWQLPYSIRVDSITNYQHTRAEEDDLIVDDLVPDAGDIDAAGLQAVRDIAVNEPLLVNRLISGNGQVTGVNVTIQLPDDGTGKEVPEVTAFARDLVKQVEAENPNLDIYLTGMVIMNNAFPEVSFHDLKKLIPMMFMVVILILILLLYSFKSLVVTTLILLTSGLVSYVLNLYFHGIVDPIIINVTVGVLTLGLLMVIVPAVAATFLVIIFTILTAMGLAGWLGIALTPPSVSAPTIILTLAVADCVHILISFLGDMRKGLDKTSAIIDSLRINLQPVFLTTLTTAIGFMSMNFSDAPPFRDLGNIVAMGVGVAFVLSVGFMPALMMLLPVRVKVGETRHARAMDRLADTVIQRRDFLFWGMGVIVVALVIFIPRNELNDEFVKYFDKSIDFRNATEFATTNLTGIYTIDYSLGTGESGGISEPDFLRDVERFSNWYLQQPRVLHVNTLTDIMKRLNKNMHGDDPEWYRLPDRRDLAAQYLLLYEMSLPYGLDLNNQIDIGKSATRLTVSLESMSTNELLALEQRAQAWLAENTPQMQTAGASPSVMFAHIGYRNIRSMLTGTTVALVLISLVLIVALRSVKIGLLSLVPNLVPAAMGFGLWGLLVGEVGLALSVVTGMTLGIVVDDTVHFLSKYLRARRERGMDSSEAVRYAFSTVGVALWVTSLVLIAGFMVLTQSAFKLNADMGLLTAITIGFALVADFLFLPPLLMKVDNS